MAFTEKILNAGDFGPGDTEWIHLIVGEWQIIADVAHSDLVLWFPTDYVLADGSVPDGISGPSPESDFTAIAHVRPSNVHTLFHHDPVGTIMGQTKRLAAFRAWTEQNIILFADDEPNEGLSEVMVKLVPIVRNNRTVALLSVHTVPPVSRTPARTEDIYYRAANNLLQMVHTGIWPDPLAHENNTRGNPRVTDGIILIDDTGKVTFASPNANSMYARMGLEGYLEDLNLADVTRDMLPTGEEADETLQLVLAGREDARTELDIGRVRVTVRSIPLVQVTPVGITRHGALLLCRDVTELRRRELELMTKDATIREIHHRVKNNLQTVSALLRLQSRRMSTPEAKHGLEQAMRRVSTIATVHEALSQGLTQSVNFDDLVQRQFHLAAELASPGQEVNTRLLGTFGYLPSQFATPLALVINEVVANAVEHGLDGEPGTVTLEGTHGENEQGEDTLTVTITDNGKGMGDAVIEESGASAYRASGHGEGLGMQIVRTLVASELNGSIRWEPNEPHGTRVIIDALLTS